MVWAFGLTLLPASAWAQSPSAGPSITGTVQGELTHGSAIVFRVNATSPGGWQDLHQLQVSLLLHGVTLDTLTYDQENQTLGASAGLPVLIGTSDIVVGTYFQMSGLDATTSTGGNRLGMTLRARLLQDVPPGATFQLAVVDDFEHEATVAKAVHVAESKGGGFSWGVLIAAIAAALFAGSFVGNVFASHRRPPQRPSVYAAVQRRIEEKPSTARKAPAPTRKADGS